MTSWRPPAFAIVGAIGHGLTEIVLFGLDDA
ncbi:hypothetical protein BH20GEM1_BH20GEM1_05820 [soil metagenome]